MISSSILRAHTCAHTSPPHLIKHVMPLSPPSSCITFPTRPRRVKTCLVRQWEAQKRQEASLIPAHTRSRLIGRGSYRTRRDVNVTWSRTSPAAVKSGGLPAIILSPIRSFILHICRGQLRRNAPLWRHSSLFFPLKLLVFLLPFFPSGRHNCQAMATSSLRHSNFLTQSTWGRHNWKKKKFNSQELWRNVLIESQQTCSVPQDSCVFAHLALSWKRMTRFSVQCEADYWHDMDFFKDSGIAFLSM